MKNETSGTQSGLSSQEKFDVKKSPRPKPT